MSGSLLKFLITPICLYRTSRQFVPYPFPYKSLDPAHFISIFNIQSLGDDADLMVDMNGNYRSHQAVRSARAIEEYDVIWIEEPMPPENASGYRKLRSKIDVPIALRTV